LGGLIKNPDPTHLVNLAFDPNRKRSEGSIARAIFKLIGFITDYERWLLTLGEFPVVQALCWEYHSYWFSYLRHEFEGLLRAYL
jgi:hypothetical protein